MFQGRIRAYLSGTCVEALRAGGLLGRRIVAQARRACAAPAPGEPAWREPVRALGALLAEAPWRGRVVNLAVSSDFVRLALLPKGEPGMREEELRALGAALITRVHGTPAGGWRMRLGPIDRANLAVAAIEEALHADLERVVKAAGCRLGSLRPVASALGRRLPRRNGAQWVALAEAGSSALALWERGEWRTLRVRPQGVGGWAELLAGLEREAARLGCVSREVLYVGEAPPPECVGWSIVHRTPAQLARLRAPAGEAGAFACLA